MSIEWFAIAFSTFGLIVCLALTLVMEYLDRRTTRLLNEAILRDEQ